MPPKAKWKIGQWVIWKHPKSGDSGDGVIKRMAHLPESTLVEERSGGWWYLLDNVWVFEDRITGEYLR